MSFPVKAWENEPSTSTPLNAEALQDLERRLAVWAEEHGGGPLPSGDPTGATDTAVLEEYLSKGGVLLSSAAATAPYIINKQLVVPDGTAGTLPGGYIKGRGEEATVVRQAAGANIAGPLITTSNIANNIGSDSGHAVTIADVTFDLNAQNQSYATAPSPNAAVGPDGVAVWNNQCDLDRVKVINFMRHAFVVLDETPNGTKAIGPGYDSRYGHLRADGFYLPGSSIPTLTCTTTASSVTVTTAESTTALKVGMVVVGNGIAPNTMIASVAGGTITLTQNALLSGSATLRFGLGLRAFWASNLSTKGSTDSFIHNLISRGTFGDWAVKIDDAGDWNVGDCHTYATAFNGAYFQFANTLDSHHNCWDNTGQAGSVALGASCPVATTSAAFLEGEALTVSPLPVTIPKNTPLVMRTAGPGGGPLYMATRTEAKAGATSLPLYALKAPTMIAEGTLVYQPLVGMLVFEGVEPNLYVGNSIDNVEAPGADYIYYCLLGKGGQTSILGPQTALNGTTSSGKGATSTGAVFISTSPGTWTIVGAELMSTTCGRAGGVIQNAFQANGRNEAPYESTAGTLIQFANAVPGSP